MSVPDIDVDLDALTGVHEALLAAAGRFDAVGTAPTPDAGAATPDVLTIMAEVIGRAGEVATGSAAAADLVAQSRAVYRDVESRNAASLGQV